MPRRWAAVVLAACLVFGLTGVAPAHAPATAPASARVSVPASAQEGTVVGRPSFDLVLLRNRVTPGGDATLSAVLVNDARVFRGGSLRDEERVTTAYNVSIRPATEEFSGQLAGNLSFEASRIPLGAVSPGVTDPIALRISVGQVPPGAYRVPFVLNYSYAAVVQPNRTVTLRSRTDIVYARLVVESEPELRVAAEPGQSLSAGENRIVRFEVTNVGTETAREVGLSLSADNGSVYFGSPLDRQSAVGLYLPALEPGETETVRVRMGADDATPAGTYLVAGRATYRDDAGEVHEAAWLAAGVPVDDGGNATREN